MNSKKLVYLMGTTFLLGGTAGLITGFILSFMDPALSEWQLKDWLVGLIGWFGGGLIFSALSLLGFFAFTLINQLGLGLFKGYKLWGAFLVILIVISYIDVIYLRYTYFAQEGESLLKYFIMPTLLLIWALLVAYKKKKETNSVAFIPALFFMFTFTIIELIPSMRENNLRSILDMSIPLIVANTWQTLTLHKLIPTKKS